MNKLTALFATVLFLSFSVVAQAQELDEVLSNYYEAIGGTEKWENLNSTKISGTASMQGMDYPFTVISKRPNMEKVVSEFQGMQYVEAFDGEVAWSLNPFMGQTAPTKKSEEETTEVAKKSFEDDLINYEEKGHKVTLDGKEEIEGTETYKISLEKDNGFKAVYFIDTEYYLPVMMRSFITSGQMKGQAIDTFMSDFQEVDGLMMPHGMVQKMGDQTIMQMRIDKVETNVELDDAEFAFPEE